MNRNIQKSRDNDDPKSNPKTDPVINSMVARLIAAARGSQNAYDMFDEAVGRLFGNNRTDARCADIVQRFGPMTAGELASRAGLSTGAVTTVIDRLEKAGIARRVADPKDRRKVYVELTEFTHSMVNIIFEPMGIAFAEAMRDVSVSDMRVIAEYLEFSERMSRGYAEILHQHTPNGKSDQKDRLQRVKSFARDSIKFNKELVRSYGQEPSEPPQPGKPLK